MTLRLSFIRKILKIHLSLSTSMENRKERAWNLMESMEGNSDWSPLMRAASKFCPFFLPCINGQGKNSANSVLSEVEKNRRDTSVFFYCGSNKGRTLLTSAFNILLQSSYFAWYTDFLFRFSQRRGTTFLQELYPSLLCRISHNYTIFSIPADRLWFVEKSDKDCNNGRFYCNIFICYYIQTWVQQEWFDMGEV